MGEEKITQRFNQKRFRASICVSGPESDADFLVRFQGTPSFDRFMDLKQLLGDTLGVRVDLVTDDALRPFMRETVERDAIRVA